jgi:2-methylcitrate dehydratase PrpD
MSIASQLANYVIHAFQDEIPESIKKIGIQAIIDQYGLQVAGSELPWSQSVYRTEKKYHQSKGLSTITRYSDQVSPIQAAFINGSFAHAKDFDDTHQEAQAHPGSVVIPAAIAIAEHYSFPGDIALKAIILGMEMMLRLSYSLSPACMEGGHHTGPTIGPFGAAIASGLLIGLNEIQLTHALGICGSFSGGLTEFTISGGSVKRIYSGLGARAGVEAALLAKEGLTGPSTIIEGKKGMWSVYGRGFAYPERLFDQLGKEYLLSSLQFKQFSCCLLIHPAINAFLDICHRHHLTATDIKQVTVGLSKQSTSHVGSIIIPEDELGAQFSTSFMLAFSLMKEPPGMWSNIKDALSDIKVIELAKRISVYEDNEVEMEFPKKNGCVVNVTTYDDKTYFLRMNDLKKSDHHVFSDLDIKKKFMLNISPFFGSQQTEDCYDLLLHFDELTSLKGIFKFLCISQSNNFFSN